MCYFCIISTPILAFSTATLQLPGIFPHTTRISDIHFQHTLSNTQSHHSHNHPEIPTHFFNLCWNFQHKTHFSDVLFQHTILKRRRGAFTPLPICLLFLPTHSNHFLLYPFTDTPQEVFQHIHSIDGKLPHEIICLFQLRLQPPVLNPHHLILSLQTLILVFKVQHLIKVCLLPLSRIGILEVIDKFFCKLCFLNRLICTFLDKCQLPFLLPVF